MLHNCLGAGLCALAHASLPNHPEGATVSGCTPALTQDTWSVSPSPGLHEAAVRQTAVDKRVAITSQRALETSGSVKQPPGLLTFWPLTPKSKDHGEGPVVYQTPNVPATPALRLPLHRLGAPAGQQHAPSTCQALGWAPRGTHSKASLCPSGI